MYTITVIEDSTGEVVKTLAVAGSGKAKRTYSGLLDRVNLEQFTVKVTPSLD